MATAVFFTPWGDTEVSFSAPVTSMNQTYNCVFCGKQFGKVIFDYRNSYLIIGSVCFTCCASKNRGGGRPFPALSGQPELSEAVSALTFLHVLETQTTFNQETQRYELNRSNFPDNL